jgi:hypothetical protein
MKPSLRYFPVRGRVQSLRHALVDAGVEFDDVQIAVEDWPQRRSDVDFGGPYRGLPTLTWEGALIAETLPIAAFLARRLGHYDGRDDVAVTQLEAIVSVAYLEIIQPAGDAIYADLMWPGADLARGLTFGLDRMQQKLGYLDAQLGDGWLGGTRPVTADFFAGEAFELQRYLLGPGREERLITRLPRLAALAQRLRARPSLAAAWRTRPPRHTARPDEEAALARLHALPLPFDA